MNGQPPPQQIQIRASDADLKGVYSNLMQVGHTQEEFMLDFFNLPAGSGMGMLTSRIILSPGHCKRILEALKTNVKAYEDRYGKITAAEGPSQEIGFKV
jgi:phosphoribosylaminoimidazole (AIR) synthetase